MVKHYYFIIIIPIYFCVIFVLLEDVCFVSMVFAMQGLKLCFKVSHHQTYIPYESDCFHLSKNTYVAQSDGQVEVHLICLWPIANHLSWPSLQAVNHKFTSSISSLALLISWLLILSLSITITFYQL